MERNNLMYNYCSNNLRYYKNKKYAYDYLEPNQKYYEDNNPSSNFRKNYENKNRIKQKN